VYRPAVVIGASRTGEMDKIDGPYYFLPLIKRLRPLPSRVRIPWPRFGDTNVVPVDYVADAIDHIAHKPGLDGRAFHIVDPTPMRSLDVFNAFSAAAGSPRLAPALPRWTFDAGLAVPGVRGALLPWLGIPAQALDHVEFNARFDATRATAALAGSGIAPPALKTYAPQLWRYWCEHLDPTGATMKGDTETAQRSGVRMAMRAFRKTKREHVEPHDDYGFFGPDSVTWKVWSYPTGLTIGFQRAVVVEELDPALIAAVDKTNAVRYRPRTRYDRTLRYFAMVAFGDSRSTSTAANVLVKVHSKAVGIEPLSGNRYDANDPHSQLWIHLTAWHSILYAYEKYGPGRLPANEEAQYWEECAVAAELQTCDPADVPRTREGVREYFESMRPKLAGSEAAQSMMDHLLNAEVMFPPTPRALAPGRWVINKALRIATIATMPQWMRKMGGLRQPKLLDVLITPVMKTAFRLVRLSTRAELLLLSTLSPSTVPIAAPILHGIPARRPETLTPAQARERYGYAKPADAHREWRARQVELMLAGDAPSDAGLIESEAVLGRLARDAA
jgi:uncharacterized protein (DUF2236 family)